MTDFKQLEKAKTGTRYTKDSVFQNLKFNDAGLIPVVAQQFDSHEVLMMAWMNREALDETLETGRVCFWSRSRQSLWRKGESSGQIQVLKELRMDCDGDTILALVNQTGPACHTGRRSCFYNLIDGDEVTIDSDPLIDPSELYKK